MNSDKFKRQIESMWKHRDTDEQKRLVKFTIAKTMRLALEYPELAQEYFDSLCKVIPDNERITVSNYQHNLTSDAVGEETLICEKSKVQRAYNTSREIVKDENPDTLMYSMHTQIMCVLESIFGTKCLPDEDIHEDNFTSIEPKPAEPKFKVGDKVTVIDYNKGLPNLSRCEHKIFTVATVKWENGGHMYTLKTNEKLFKKSDYLDHLDWCEDYLEPYVEPEINTFKDLRKSGKYNRYLLCNDRYQEIALECMNPYERKMFATGIIAQLKEYYGGMVPFPQPIGCAKIVLCPDAEKFEVDIYRDWDALMTFHNIEQAERFLKYNEQLVRDYYMLPRKEESC